MGCIASKNSTPANIELTEVEPKDKTDTVIGLTKRQRLSLTLIQNNKSPVDTHIKLFRFLLKGSWKGISRELQATGVRLFIQ